MNSNDITITWSQPDERDMGREDTSWYTYGSSHDLVCTLTKGEDSISVYADGEMRVLVYDKTNRDRYDIVRYCDQWREHGITNDEDIVRASEHAEIEWVNNSWFDLYSNTDDASGGEHLDCVEFTLSDAIERATAILNEGITKGEYADSMGLCEEAVDNW